MATVGNTDKKSSYKVTNWRKYNESLVCRGDVTFWFSEDVIETWEHANDEPKVGRPFVYSNTAIESLLVQTNAENNTFCGDGAYDQWKVYETLAAQEIRPIIPPRKNAKIRQHGNTATEPIARDEAIRTIRREGRKQWKKEVNYHRPSLSETAMHRIKCCFGYKLTKSSSRPPTHRSSSAVQNPQPIYPTRATAVRVELVNKAVGN